MRTVRAVLACALACVCWPAVAQGAAATAAEVRTLALAAAQRDGTALERLRAIDVIDGRPARLREALGGTDPEVRSRLRALAQRPVRSGPVEPGAARAQAREVLDQRRFQRTKVPSPLRDVRERVGEALRSIGRPFEAAFRWLADRIPGGRAVLWALLATLVLLLAAFFAGRSGARRDEAAAESADGDGEELRSAVALLAEAERAERRGELEQALRLRFRAGLVALDDRRLIELRPALTNRELLGVVPSETLVELVEGFESVAYGGRPADADDLRSAREGWPRVPEEADAR